jgi:hypothetical protein
MQLVPAFGYARCRSRVVADRHTNESFIKTTKTRK